MSTTATTSPMDLTKLTVPQLKAVCKERRITGYSKLGKAALLQRLAAQNSSGVDTPSSSSTATNAVPQEMSVDLDLVVKPVSVKKDPGPKKPKEAAKPSPSMQQKLSGVVQGADSFIRDCVPSSIATRPTSSTAAFPIPVQPDFIPPRALVGTKRSSEVPKEDTATDVPNKKRKTLQTLTMETNAFIADSLPSSVRKSTPVLSKKISGSMAPPLVSNTTKAQTGSGSKIPARMEATAIESNQTLNLFSYPIIPKHSTFVTSSMSMRMAPNTALAPQTIETGLKATLPKGKRFKPLVLKKNASPQAVFKFSSDMSLKAASSSLISATGSAFSSTVPLHHLDFPKLPFDSLMLVPITLPPKLSRRKHVHRWSVILSGLSDEERRQCALVSRMFRYSVYLSAITLLKRNFDGRRLAYMTSKYPQNMTNMWPYLRQRELEVNARIHAYNESFLAKYFKGFCHISERLRTSPDNEKQAVVAIRFILTRLWFLISLGGGGNDPLAWSRGVVVDAQEVVEDEIWTVTVRTTSSQADGASRMQIFYVLEHTCEVVGHPIPPAHPTDSSTGSNGSALPASTTQLRADWSAYIAIHVSSRLPLLTHLKWQNHEEYYRGLSKLWLKKIAGEGELGSAKRVVADRYVLACVVGNSVSGRWMTSTQMEQAFAGNAAITPARAQSQQVHIFLPAHHHVESLHFTAANGRPLHEALAVVQTPGREYYILRDNGAQVGCSLGEEDGVGPIWMELLGCTILGEKATHA